MSKKQKSNPITANNQPLITKTGFTLVELLIAIVIMGGITITASKILFNMVSYRSKQFAIEDTSSSFRDFVTNFGNEVKSSSSIDITDSSNIIIRYTDSESDSWCVKYQLSDETIKRSVTAGSDCTNTLAVILQNNIHILNAPPNYVSEFSGSGEIVSLKVSGMFKDALTETPFRFQTSVKPRM